MILTHFTSKNIGTNGYLIKTGLGNILIDAPGGVSEWLNQQEIQIHTLLVTHQHYDHVEDAALIQETGAILYAWAPYSKNLTLETWGEAWGLPKIKPYSIDQLLKEDQLSILGQKINISHIPGHSTDSIVFHFPEHHIVFGGDVLFKGSVGRCDLPEGSFEQLKQGIETQLFVLPDSTKVYPGHGDNTTTGVEKRSNPYMK